MKEEQQTPYQRESVVITIAENDGKFDVYATFDPVWRPDEGVRSHCVAMSMVALDAIKEYINKNKVGGNA